MVLVVSVFNFPGVGSVLTWAKFVGSIPVVFEVGELVNEFSPAVINTDFYLKVVTAYNSKILIEHVAIRGKGIRDIEKGIKKDIDLTLGCASILIGEIYSENGILIRGNNRRLASWAGHFVLRSPQKCTWP